MKPISIRSMITVAISVIYWFYGFTQDGWKPTDWILTAIFMLMLEEFTTRRFDYLKDGA